MKPYYEHAGIVIYHGDSREVVPTLARADLLLTDPPYGVGLKGKRTKHAASFTNEGYAGAFEDSPEYVGEVVVPVVRAGLALCTRGVIFPGTRNMFQYPTPDDIGCVFCPNGAGRARWGFNCFNPILYYGSDPFLQDGAGSLPNSISQTAAAQPNGHPCPKPLHWITWLVNRASRPGEAIIDAFCGSGTTLVAAKLLGRTAVGVELEEQYCEIAAKRLSQEMLPFIATETDDAVQLRFE